MDVRIWQTLVSSTITRVVNGEQIFDTARSQSTKTSDWYVARYGGQSSFVSSPVMARGMRPWTTLLDRCFSDPRLAHALLCLRSDLRSSLEIAQTLALLSSSIKTTASFNIKRLIEKVNDNALQSGSKIYVMGPICLLLPGEDKYALGYPIDPETAKFVSAAWGVNENVKRASYYYNGNTTELAAALLSLAYDITLFETNLVLATQFQIGVRPDIFSGPFSLMLDMLFASGLTVTKRARKFPISVRQATALITGAHGGGEPMLGFNKIAAMLEEESDEELRWDGP